MFYLEKSGGNIFINFLFIVRKFGIKITENNPLNTPEQT